MIRRARNSDMSATDPTPEEIRRRSEAIRQTWSPRERARRSGFKRPNWVPPVFAESELAGFWSADFEVR
jgi:hypothetical protein